MDRGPNFYAASCLILTKGGEVLLQRWSKLVWRGGFYGMPAGHIEGTETVFGAMQREVKEEIGIEVAEKDAVLVHVMHRVSENRVYFDFFYKTEKWTGKLENKESEKCDELKWFPLDALPKNIIPYLKRVLKQIQKGIFFSEENSNN